MAGEGIIMLVDLLFLITGVGFLLIFCYLLFLAAASLWPRKKELLSAPAIRFGVIIPAHNESELIGRTLKKLQSINYPSELYEVIVVADNCDDNTGEIAESLGASCLYRYDPDKRGKGAALHWVFPQLLSTGNHDAYVVIDADTHMAENFLTVINHHLLQGAEVVQAYSEPRHPDRSPLESLAFLGFALNRNLRYHGRSRLGWSANLMGTGMCFARNIIAKYGWNTTTMVEDIEYGMFLRLQNVRVVFAYDARISVEIHKDIDQSQGQRTRWDMGKFEVRNRYLPQLLRKGIEKRDLGYFDSAMELLLPPFSIFVIMVLACFGLYVLFDFQKETFNFYIWISIVVSLIFYIFTGLLTARASFKVYRSLFYAPFFLLWRSWILLLESFKGKNKQRQW